MTAGSFRYCPFCKKAKAALQQDLGSNFTVVEVIISFDRNIACSRLPGSLRHTSDAGFT